MEITEKANIPVKFWRDEFEVASVLDGEAKEKKKKEKFIKCLAATEARPVGEATDFPLELVFLFILG